MKGLIIKDIMCLRKQLTSFCFVMAGVIIVSILYVLSARFGNLAVIGTVLQDEKNNLSATDVKNIGAMALVMFMLIPIATVGDMLYVFLADGKAGFVKVSSVLPVSLKKRMLARFLSIYTLFGLGVLIDLLLAAMLSLLTDIMTFGELFGVIISAASLMCIYSALVILFCTLLGYGKELYAQALTLLTMAAAVILVNFSGIKRAFINIFMDEGFDKIGLWKPLDFFREKGYVLFLIAVTICVASYFVSVWIAEKKRGVI